MPHRFAVLIGVNHYDNAGQGVGAPLRAPANDAADWYSLLRRLNMRDGHVRLLSSPALSPGELNSAAVSCQGATTETVNQALDWLVSQLAGAGDQALGFVFFAGHGDLVARAGSALYLSDYDSGAPQAPGHAFATAGALDLEALRLAVETKAPAATLVAVVDACRPTAGPGTLTGPVEGIDRTWQQGRHILVTAAARGQDSYERCFDGRWRGQLSWACRTVIDQWATDTESGAGAYVALPFDELVRRANLLIEGVSGSRQPQTVEVIASAEGAGTSVLATFGEGDASAEPMDAPGHEWDPGTTGVSGTISDANGTVGYFKVTPNPNSKLIVWSNAPLSTYPSLSFTLPSTQPAVFNPPASMNASACAATTLSSPGPAVGSTPRSNGTTQLSFTPSGGLIWRRAASGAPLYLPGQISNLNTATSFSPNGLPVRGAQDNLVAIVNASYIVKNQTGNTISNVTIQHSTSTYGSSDPIVLSSLAFQAQSGPKNLVTDSSSTDSWSITFTGFDGCLYTRTDTCGIETSDNNGTVTITLKGTGCDIVPPVSSAHLNLAYTKTC